MTEQEFKEFMIECGATHYLNGEYYAKDMIGRWCSLDECGNAWPMHSREHEYYDENLKPL